MTTEPNADKTTTDEIMDLLTPDPWGQAKLRADRVVPITEWIPYREFFSREGSFNGGLYRGVCRNHREMKYLTKGPGRSLHFVPDDPSLRECTCSISDLMIDPVQP